jgi:hypothetical protein
MAHLHGREFSLSTLIFPSRSGTFEKPKSFDRNDNGLFANDFDERENPGGRAGIRKIHYRTLHFARVGKRCMVFLRALDEGIRNEESHFVTRSRRNPPLANRNRYASKYF